MKIKLSNQLIGRGVVMLLAVICLVWGLSSSAMPSLLTYSTDSPEPLVITDWSQLVDDQWVEIPSITSAIPVPVGTTVTFQASLPENTFMKDLFFYSENQEVRVWIDGELIYSFLTDEVTAMLQTPGYSWHSIQLTEDMANATLQIEYTCPFERYHLGLYDMYCVGAGQSTSFLIDDCWVLLTAALVLIILALIAYMDMLTWKQRHLRNYLHALGDLYLCSGLWLLAEIGFYDLFFNRPILSYLLDMALLRLLPIAFWYFVCTSLPRPYPVMKWLGWVLWANLFGGIALQLCGISLVDTLALNNITIILGASVCVAVYLHSAKYMGGVTRKNLLYFASAILMMGCLAEIVVYYSGAANTSTVGVCATISLLIYTCVSHVSLVHQESVTAIEKETLEQQNKKLRNTALMKQMKAHFIFNSLNAISALCKVNAAKADQAVQLFAKYMRAHMYLINQDDCIPFYRELDLVNAYLKVEQLRFGEELIVHFDIQYDDFDIPPLSIQPLVENAMVHGVRMRSGQGTISICTRIVGDWVEVIVSDDGVGFDVAKLSKDESVGLTNMKSRIMMMTDGTVDIRSKIGKGTVITICIPL